MKAFVSQFIGIRFLFFFVNFFIFIFLTFDHNIILGLFGRVLCVERPCSLSC